jgi:hypothetical protein
MSRFVGLNFATAIPAISALAAVTFAAAPASAATYIGTLNGTITSGSATYQNYYDFMNPPVVVDLTGQPIKIAFESDVTLNFTDTDGTFYPKYVVNTLALTIPAPAPFDTPFSEQSNNMHSDYPGSVDYTGDAQSGTFTSYSVMGSNPDPDSPLDVVFTFAGASPVAGPLTGSGTVKAGYMIPVVGAGADDTLSIAFTLSNGFVTATGAPEPASWTLMIAGFGAVGSALRLRGRRTTARLAAG